MRSEKVKDPAPLQQEVEKFSQEMEGWIQDCISEFVSAEPTNIHDQGTYTTGWEPYLQAMGGDSKTYHFLTDLRDKINLHFTKKDVWHHGYWRMQEAHHGTEHFELFIGALHRMKPEDGETIRQLVDVAEHIGNWSNEVPSWFHWDQGLFHSMHFGTGGVGKQEGADLNVPDHLRCTNICLLAYQATKEQRYLDHSILYGLRWADAILSQTDIPIGIQAEAIILDLSGEMNEIYRNFAGELPKDMSRPVDRAENILASGGIDTFLNLYSKTGKDTFLKATEKLLDRLVVEVTDPDAGAAVHMIRKYRQITGNDKYDDKIRQAVKQADVDSISEISLGLPRTTLYNQRRQSGIGKRTDRPIWYENGKLRKHSPILLAFAAEITHDRDLAARAVQLACIYMKLARQNFSHGREHGCKGSTVSSVARGHGRDNHAGMTTAVFQPICEAFM